MELPLSDYRKMAVAEFDTTKLLAHASQQAKERGYDRFPIVDVDSHHYESESMAEIELQHSPRRGGLKSSASLQCSRNAWSQDSGTNRFDI